VERFFDALDSGDWDETHRLFKNLEKELDGRPGLTFRKYWRAILEAYGAAEQVHCGRPNSCSTTATGFLIH
jgi:hypothetical protein